MYEIRGKYTSAKIMIDGLESSAVGQVTEMANNECFTNPVSIMPDAHAGKGCVVGFTMELSDKLIPNIIGSDIGCGMMSGNMGKNLFISINKDQLDREIRKVVPVGTNARNNVSQEFDDKLFYHRINVTLSKLRVEYGKRFDKVMPLFTFNENEFNNLCEQIGASPSRVLCSIGTLGGGNHFIEIGKSDETGNYWLTIHSGSRNFGKCVAEYHQKVASRKQNTPLVSKDEWVTQVKGKYDKKDWMREIARYQEIYGHKKSPKGMEYLEDLDMYKYLCHMVIAQIYADFNRKVMMDEIYSMMDKIGIEHPDFNEEISTIHNFIDFDDWIIRKGAIRSYVGEKSVLPWNAEDGLVFIEGKSNPEWNYSAPHGAGRLFSRSEAKRTLNLEDARKSMKDKGIYSSGIPHDEIKGAYKDPEIIETCIKPTATIIDRVKPVLNLKGG